MSNPPQAQRGNVVSIRESQLQPAVREAIYRQLDDVVDRIETTYTNTRTNAHPPRAVAISMNINYNIEELLDPNVSPPFPPQPADQVNLVGSGTFNVHLQIARLPSPNPDPTTEAQRLLDTAVRLLGSFPTADVNDLPDDKKSCPICTELYPVGDGEDRPIVLKCGHVVGRKCIEQWVLGRHNSCPMCRAAIFEPDELR